MSKQNEKDTMLAVAKVVEQAVTGVAINRIKSIDVHYELVPKPGTSGWTPEYKPTIKIEYYE